MAFGFKEQKFQKQPVQSRLRFQILHQKSPASANKVSVFHTYFSYLVFIIVFLKTTPLTNAHMGSGIRVSLEASMTLCYGISQKRNLKDTVDGNATYTLPNLMLKLKVN